MTPARAPASAEIDELVRRLDREAERSGYHVNPDPEFARGLAEGLLVNELRYGYRACPCRLARGDADFDRDIVCPCDYRDADLLDWGSCYCGLYVSDDVRRGERDLARVPERRLLADREQAIPAHAPELGRPPMWRCRVCGYLCARERPPATCPICGAAQDRFEVYD